MILGVILWENRMVFILKIIILKCIYLKIVGGFYNVLFVSRYKLLIFFFDNVLIIFDFCFVCGFRLVYFGFGCRLFLFGFDFIFVIRIGFR